MNQRMAPLAGPGTRYAKSMASLRPSGGRGRLNALAGAMFVAAICVGLALAVSASAAPSCLGKKATIVGTPGNDRIAGTKDHDVIVGGGGNDTIVGKGGHDRICGGPGDDRINGNRGSDLISGGGGDDTLIGFRGSDRLYGGAGDDTLIGFRGIDRLYGGGGNDTLHGGRGSDLLYGGPGDDSLFGDSGNDTLDGGGGRDRVDGGLGDERLVSGGPGDFDIVIGGAGVDRIDGGPGEHDIASYTGSSAPLTVDLSSGRMTGAETERLTGIEDVLGGSGNDTLIGDSASNRLDGGPGSDHLQAVGGGDAAFGGPGSDTCAGGFASKNSCGAGPGGGSAVVIELIASIDDSSSLVITGTPGPDSVSVSQNGGVYLAEGPGGTSVTSGDGSCARASSASVSCGGSAHRILATMGGGDDTLTLNGTPRGVNAVLDGGPGSDNLTGGPGRDTLYGGDDRVPDTLSGGGEDDILFGVNTAHPRQDSGAATMFGGGGDDILVGGQPCNGDFFSGGPGGNDTASFARIRNGGIFVHAQIGGRVFDPDVRNCNAGRIDGTVERIEGSPGPDVLIGDNSANTLLGRGGNDFLDGKGGYDRCIGGGGADRAQSCEQSFSIP